MILDSLKDFKYYGNNEAELQRSNIILGRVNSALEDFVETTYQIHKSAHGTDYYIAAAKWKDGLLLTNKALNIFLRAATNDMLGVMPIEYIKKHYHALKLERGFYPLSVHPQLLDGSKNPGQLQLKTRSYALEQLAKMRDRLVDEFIAKNQKIENLTSEFKKVREQEVKTKMWNHLDSIEKWLCMKGAISSAKLDTLRGQASA